MGKGAGGCDDRNRLQMLLPGMTDGKPTLPSLIPLADFYVEQGWNVLLSGLHGTGKTESLVTLAAKHGLKLKYYSCSTLDPYTDLVGVPVPRLDADGHEVLQMIRPKEIDDAEIIFFDEVNRASEKTINAIFEITQFHTINGEPLPNLRMVWAAINPPDNEYEYTVDRLDRAFADRFDAYVEIKPQPSVAYMSQYVPVPIAEALKQWWDDHDQGKLDAESYVSPRRLMKIGLAYHRSGGLNTALQQSLPFEGIYDWNKLAQMLDAAHKGTSYAGDSIGSAAQNFKYEPAWLGAHQSAVAAALKKNPNNFETHQAIINSMKGISIADLYEHYFEIIPHLQPALLEPVLAKSSSEQLVDLAKGYNAMPGYRRRPLSSFGKMIAQTCGVEFVTKQPTQQTGNTPTKNTPFIQRVTKEQIRRTRRQQRKANVEKMSDAEIEQKLQDLEEGAEGLRGPKKDDSQKSWAEKGKEAMEKLTAEDPAEASADKPDKETQRSNQRQTREVIERMTRERENDEKRGSRVFFDSDEESIIEPAEDPDGDIVPEPEKPTPKTKTPKANGSQAPKRKSPSATPRPKRGSQRQGGRKRPPAGNNGGQ